MSSKKSSKVDGPVRKRKGLTVSEIPDVPTVLALVRELRETMAPDEQSALAKSASMSELLEGDG